MTLLRKYVQSLILEGLLTEMVLIRGVGKNETSNVDLFGKGLYLTDDIEVASFYGDKIQKYNINGNLFDTTRNFSSSELVLFFKTFDRVFTTNLGQKLLQGYKEMYDGTLPETIDYIGISHSLNSDYKIQQLWKKHGLLTNDFNSYANDCTAMNLVLKNMGYVGLKYSTTEIEDLDDIGLGSKNAYVIFDQTAISETK